MMVARYLFVLILTVIGSAVASPTAFAQDGAYGDVSASDIALILKREGYPVETDIDSAGDPIVWSKLAGRRFGVFFYNCRGATERRCQEIQFYAGFDVEGAFSPDVMNDWNRTRRFGRGYVDGEGDPILEMDVNAVGSTDLQLRDSLMWWQALMGEFETFIAANLPAPPGTV